MGIQAFADARRRWLVAFSTVAIVLSLFPGATQRGGARWDSGVPSGRRRSGGHPGPRPRRAARRPEGGRGRVPPQAGGRDDDPPARRRPNLSIDQAAGHRNAAADAAKALKKTKPPISPVTFNGPWTEISPNPIVQVNRGSNTFYAVSGRVSALAIRPSNGQKILGGAQGGIWTTTRRRAPGSRGRTTRTPCRSAPSRSPRPTTPSSMPGPARATCQVTATSATVS